MINGELEVYIKRKIFPLYLSCDGAHDINHIKYVINRSLKFASMVNDINLNMVYTIAAYHDLGDSFDRKNHEKISASILLSDNELKKYFNDEELIMMSEAIIDHRASLDYEPRSIYGKIVSSADRNVNVDDIFYRTYEYILKHRGYLDTDEILLRAYNHISDKFGKNGYAREKMYFEDDEYTKFLFEIWNLLDDKEEFCKRYKLIIKERENKNGC